MANKIYSYKGNKIGKDAPKKVSKEELDLELSKMVEQATSTKVKEGKAEIGDIVNIDFEGFIDGTAFEGGKGEHYDLELGSGSFIPGFESQLVGASKGDEVDVNVSFPENYHAENLKGKPALFKCKVHEVKQKVKAELNDDFAKMYGIPSVEELKKALEAQMNFQKEQESHQEYLRKLTSHLVSNSEITVTDEVLNKRIEEMLVYYDKAMAQFGTDLKGYLQATNSDLDSFKKQIEPEAIESAKVDVIYDEIAEKENLYATEEDVESYINMFKAQYQNQLSEEQVQEFKNSRLEEIKKEISRQKVSKFLDENNN